MNDFLNYWEHIPSAHRVWILVGGMVVFWLIEGYYPLFRFSFKRYRHAGVNLVFLTFTLVLNIIFGFTTVLVCSWVTTQQVGLLNLVHLPEWIQIIAALFFLDFFGQYAPHYLMHRIKWMWKFHMIHHSDSKVDVTTGTRHHPGEWIIRESFTVLGVLLIGVPVSYYFLYRSVSGFFTHFTHANIQMPPLLDKTLRCVFVSPNLHKVHHHFERPLTDTNFANIFSLWDRIFGTYAYTEPQNLKYGLDVLDENDDEDLAYQLRIPFDKRIKTDY